MPTASHHQPPDHRPPRGRLTPDELAEREKFTSRRSAARPAGAEAPVVTVTTVSVIGGVRVQVPPGVRVEISGSACSAV